MKLRALVLFGLLAACRQPPPVDSATTTAATVAAAPVALAPAQRQPGECETLFDVETPDTLRLRDGNVVLYANEQVGLAVVDVSDADRPKMKGVSELVGEPAGVFVLRGLGVLVATPSSSYGTVTLRAIAIDSVRTVNELTLSGRIRDARRVGDFVVVTRTTDDGMTAVTSFGVSEKGLVKHDEVVLDGRAAVTGASPRGIAVARNGATDQVLVTWIAMHPDTGGFATRGTTSFAGWIPRWRPSRGVIDVTEDDRARFVTCSSTACDASGTAAYAAVDFANPSEPRVTSWNLLARAGDGVIGFQGTRLVVARPTTDRSDASELSFYGTETGLVPIGRVRLRGTVGSIAVRDSGDVVTIGWTGSASAGKRAILHQIDAKGTPRLVGAATFGGDWTWTRAYDDDRALGFDPRGAVAALPMTTVRGPAGPTNAAQIFSFESDGPKAIGEEPVTLADRLLFVNGRLLAFSPDGVVVLRREGETGTEHRWR